MIDHIIETIDKNNAFIDAAFGLTSKDGIDIRTLIEETTQLCLDHAYYQGLCDAYRNKAVFELSTGDPDVGIEFLKKMENLIDIYDLDDENRVRLYHGYMFYYGEVVGDMEKGAEYCRLGIKKAEEHQVEEMIQRMRLNLAVFYLFFKRYQAGIDLLLSTLEYYEYYGDDNITVYCHGNLGEGYLGIDDLDLAYKHYKIAYDGGIKYHNVPIITEGAVGLSKIYERSNQYELAIEVLLEASKKTDTVKRDRYTTEIEIELARIYVKKGDFNRVKDLIKVIKAHSDVSNYMDSVEIQKIIIAVAVHEEDYKTAYECQQKLDEIHQLMDKEKAENDLNEMVRNEYSKTVERLETIATIGREASIVRDLDEVSLLIKQKLSHIMHIDSIGVGEVIEDRIYNSSSFDGDAKLPENIKSVDDEKSLAAWAVRNKKEVLINDVSRDYKIYVKGLTSRSAANTSKFDIKSLLYAPLIHEDTVIGVFTIQSYEKNAYSPEEVEIFRIMALYVTTALYNIRQSKILENMAFIDSLTNIYNRRGFVRAYEEYLESHKESIKSVSMILLDLDHFKAINDVYGHPAGDEILEVVAKRLKAQQQEGIAVGRLGGEEFAVVLFDRTMEEARKLAEKIRLHVQAIHVEVAGEVIPVTTSLGVAHMMLDADYTYKKLYHQGDQALYTAKESGRNRVEIFKAPR